MNRATLTWVYLMEAGGLVKIGHSLCPSMRRYAFSAAAGCLPVIIHLIETDAGLLVERHLHQRFAAKRVHGEWFALSEADIDSLRAISQLTRDDLEGEDHGG